jgi:O-antigen chain-terminating methyltransferase
MLLLHTRIDHYLDPQPKNPNLKETEPNIIQDDFYLSFENKFRGSRDTILNRYKPYIDHVPATTKTALDIGCGRGEWVELLQQKNISAKGIDLNFAMLNIGLSHGVKDLSQADAFEYLSTCKSNTFDLISAFHIIEHIPYQKLLTLLQEIKRVATPNATILLETPNPQNPKVASYEFYKDPTHRNPLPAPVIAFMVEYIGFNSIKTIYLNPLNQDTNPTPQTSGDYLILCKA